MVQRGAGVSAGSGGAHGESAEYGVMMLPLYLPEATPVHKAAEHRYLDEVVA